MINFSENNWFVKDEILYYSHFTDVAVARYIGENLFISLDISIIKHVFKLIDHLESNNIAYMYTSPNYITEDINMEEVLEYCFFAILDENVFAYIENRKYIEKLTAFIRLYDINMHYLKVVEELEFEKDIKIHNLITNQQYYKYENNVRNYIGKINRKIFLKLIE